MTRLSAFRAGCNLRLMADFSRILMAAALSCLLIATGQKAAQASGVGRAADKMVICTGLGPRVIFIDAEGNPTAAPHACPDCLLGMLQGLLAQGFVLAGVSNWQKLQIQYQEQVQTCPVPVMQQARDPPWQL